MTRLSIPMISRTQSVNVIHYVTNLIRADTCGHAKVINSTQKHETLSEFADFSYMVCGRNWIAISFGMMCDIYQRYNEMLASCESEWGFEREYDIIKWKRGATSRERGVLDVEHCVEERSTQKLMEEWGMRENSAKSRQRSTSRDLGGKI